MKITVVSGDKLTPELVLRWSQIQRQQPALASPYFRPEFTRAVAAVRGDVEVGVMQQGGEVVGFFPYQRSRRNVGQPVGGRLSDYQGVIAGGSVCWDAEELLRGCRLRAWHFDHLLTTQEPFRKYHRVVEESPYIDIGDGFDAYRAARPKSGTTEIRQTLRKARKMEREVGPLCLELHTVDDAVFEALIDWKTTQYRRTKVPNALGHPWSIALLKQVLAQQSEAFSGMMSAVYVGDRLAAVHLGMRSYDVLHMWFPAYDREFYEYSPGLILTVRLLQAAESLGIRTVDFGKGSSPYKLRLATGAFAVAEGAVDFRPLARRLRNGWRSTRQWVRSSPLRKPAQLPADILYRVTEWFAFR